MKKILTLLFVALLTLVLCGCANKQEEKTATKDVSVEPKMETKTETKEETKDDEKEETPVEETEKESTETPETSKEEPKEEVKKDTATIDPYGYLGKKESEFTNSLSNLGFTNVVKIDTVYNNDYPEGTICYYLPDGEQKLTTKISYKVSKGPKPVEQKPAEEVQKQAQQEQPKEKAPITVVNIEYWRDYDTLKAYGRVTFSDGTDYVYASTAQSMHITKLEDGSFEQEWYTDEDTWSHAEEITKKNIESAIQQITN